MYFDMSKYNINDLKDGKEKSYIEGYLAAIDDLQNALHLYYEEHEEEEIELFSALRWQISEDFFNYAQDFLYGVSDELTVDALDQQAAEENNNGKR